MGKFFSDTVEQALEYVCYNERAGRGKEGFAMLEEASAAGDGDASCILARCLWGPEFIWSGHQFQEDDARGEKLICLSVEQGSAIGTLLAVRMQKMTPVLKKKMKFASLQEAFDIVQEKAEAGDAFCQYTIGNMYYWWDFLEIQGKSRDSFSSLEAFRDYLRENITKCEEWFKKAFQGGMWLAGNNLYNYYLKGDNDIIAPQPEKAKKIWQQGAEHGYPVHQRFYADQLSEAGDKAGAFKWYLIAAEGGELAAYYYVGRAYEKGEGVAQDYTKAAQWYQDRLEYGQQVGCCNCLGAMYYEARGVKLDYDKAFSLIKYAYDEGSTWGVYYLGTAYFYGRGTAQDYVKAREILEKVDWNNHETFYCLGVIYGQGLGVEADIPKAVGWLQKAGNYGPAQEEMRKYKKTLFGKWVRR